MGGQKVEEKENIENDDSESGVLIMRLVKMPMAVSV